MQCKEIIQVIEATFPRTAALGFDNVGLLAGRSEKEVSRIYLALDATDVVIDRAIKEGADMLITHHPLLFSAVKKVTDEDFITRRIVKLIQNDISYYAMHTNSVSYTHLDVYKRQACSKRQRRIRSTRSSSKRETCLI